MENTITHVARLKREKVEWWIIINLRLPMKSRLDFFPRWAELRTSVNASCIKKQVLETECLCPPKVHILKSSFPKWWYLMWGLWEVIKFKWCHEGGTLMMAFTTLILMKRERDTRTLSFCHVRIQQQQGRAWAKKRALTRNWIGQHLNLVLPSLQKHKK